jgi:hypothetical protein
VSSTGGTLNFNTSTLRITGATANFGSAAISNAGGQLQFIATGAGTAFTPNNTETFPAVVVNLASGLTLTIQTEALSTGANNFTLTQGNLTCNSAVSTAALSIAGNGAVNLGTGLTHSASSISCSGGNATINFNGSVLAVSGNPSFANLFDVQRGAAGGTLRFSGAGPQAFTIWSSATSVPNIDKTGGGTTTSGAALSAYSISVSNGTFNQNGALTTNALTVTGGALNINSTASATSVGVSGGTLTMAGALTSSGALTMGAAGTFDMGTGPYTHAVTAVSGTGGTVTFRDSKLQITGGNADFRNISVNANTGTLEISRNGGTTQIYSNANTFYNILKSGTTAINVNDAVTASNSFSITNSGLWTWAAGPFTHSLKSLSMTGGSMTFNNRRRPEVGGKITCL